MCDGYIVVTLYDRWIQVTASYYMVCMVPHKLDCTPFSLHANKYIRKRIEVKSSHGSNEKKKKPRTLRGATMRGKEEK